MTYPGQELFSTDFGTSAEDPISQGGKWLNGAADGTYWSNVVLGSGHAYAKNHVEGTKALYADGLAQLKTSVVDFQPDQFAVGTVYKSGSYTASAAHEIELLLRFEITANNARGYEVLWGLAANGSQAYVAIVRWNGTGGDYSAIYDPGNGSIAMPVTGDVLRAEIRGSSMTVTRNGTAVVSNYSLATDIYSNSLSIWSDGQPGIGFWPKPGATLDGYGWDGFAAGNL